MPTTPRERLQEEHFFIRSRTEIVDGLAKEVWTLDEDALISCVDTLLEEARQEMKENIKKYIDENRVIINSNDIFSVRCEKEATNNTLDDLEYFTQSL